MMLRNLLHEIVRRRLWPIPVLALLVAIAAPVLFLKSSPTGAPAAAAPAPAPATAGELPARAQRLLAATGAGSRGGATGAAHDPFQPPAAQIAAAKSAAAAAAGGASGAAKGASKPASTPAKGSGSAAATPTKPAPAPAPATITPTTPSTGVTTPAPALTASNAAVDVRFAARANGRVHRAIPRLQPYFIHGQLAAVFVKYSPSRHKAVFAVAPGLVITGPVRCRRLDGVCRYLDIPAGSYARLTMVTPGRVVVKRRLDVVRITNGGNGSATTATVANDRGEAVCLLAKLRAQKAGAAPIDRDACVR